MGKIKRLLDRFDEMGRYPIQELGYSRTWLMFSYLGAFLVHRCTIADYFLYHFYERNRRGRAEFVTLYDMRDIHRKNPRPPSPTLRRRTAFWTGSRPMCTGTGSAGCAGTAGRNSTPLRTAIPAASSSPALTPAATAWSCEPSLQTTGIRCGSGSPPRI